MSDFSLFVGIDYSGAQTPTSRLKGLQVYAARSGGAPEQMKTPAAVQALGRVQRQSLPRYWTRAEVYPSIFRNRYPRSSSRSVDEQDAWATARWLAGTASGGHLPRYFDPPLTREEREIAGREGWILGIA